MLLALLGTAEDQLGQLMQDLSTVPCVFFRVSMRGPPTSDANAWSVVRGIW